MIGQPNKKAPGRTVRLRPQDSAVAGNLPTPRAGHNRGYLSRRSRSESSSTSFSRSQSKDGAETACYGPKETRCDCVRQLCSEPRILPHRSDIYDLGWCTGI